jgi:hypothetical protein
MIYYYIRFILLISLIGCSLTLTAQDIDSEAVVLEDDSDSMNSDNSEDRVEDDGLEDENFDADDSEGFMDEDESEELDFESDEQSKSKDKVQLKPTDPTSIKLIDLHLKALGGVENLKAINSLKMEGEFREGKKSWNMTWFKKAPNKYRVERHHRPLGRDYITVKAYNGKSAWVREVSPEILPPENMSKGDTTAFAQEAEFYNHLIDWREKGHRFNYIDKIKVRKQPTYFVQGKLKDGRDVFYYFDPENFLLKQFGFKERFAGSLVDADYVPIKFTKINGVWMEEKKQYLVEGRVYKEINYNKILANVDIPDSLFEVPEVKEFILRQKSR